jgi:hypothetical protein
MKIAHFNDIPEATPVKRGFRGGDIRFKDLLLGVEGRPDNYGLQWVTVDGAYYTPQHRHNFEQVRIMIEGSFGFGPGLIQEPGSIGYFCESTYYTQKADERSVTLLLQIGGPSGAGFMSREQLRKGIEELSTRGQFNDGVFTWHDNQGKKHNQDSYEAVWEHVHQRKLNYAKPQFNGPILMRPECFAWVDVASGVSKKLLGRFHERGLELSQLKLKANTSFVLPTQEQAHILVCIEGHGNIGLSTNDQSVSAQNHYLIWTSIACDKGEAVSIQATHDSVFWLFGLPTFE